MIELEYFAKLDQLPDFGLRKVEDLVVYEGPLLTELRSKQNEPFLAYWVDCDATCNRWMYLRPDESSLIRMKMRKLAMERVFPNGSKDGFVYFVDLDDSLGVVGCYMVYCKDVPEEYQPVKSQLLPVATHRSSDLLTIAIDGEWEHKELSSFPKELAYAYSFISLESKQGTDEYERYQWRYRGGFSPSSFGKWIERQVMPTSRLDLQAMQYASPGFIKYRIDTDVSELMLKLLNNFSNNRGLLRHATSDLDAYIKENKLDEYRDKKIKDTVVDWGLHDQPLRSLSIDVWRAIWSEQAGKALSERVDDAYNFSHITRWFWRRLKKLDEYQERNLATFPSV